MSYDLAVWVGDRPPDDDTASRVFESQIERSRSSSEPPRVEIQGFVAALTSVYPEGTMDGIWAFEPLLDGAIGGLLILNMTTSDHLDDVVTYATRLAKQHGLVAFDPQFSELSERQSKRSEPAQPPPDAWQQAQQTPRSRTTVLVQMRVEGPLGSCGIEDESSQEFLQFRPADHWTTTWCGPEAEKSNTGIATWLQVPDAEILEFVVTRGEAPAAPSICVASTTLVVPENSGYRAWAGTRTDIGDDAAVWSALTRFSLTPGQYPLEVWVDADRREHVRRITYVLADPVLTNPED
ncbi:hypothetical protein [Nocardioides sp. WS12]|uniref:hypothetical protein n=1 Tax=Nocardioides sp. WS12 TaxID=2486272 RepID=UPI0015F990B8|nr:hypothetical protein [Nocardioides sp. WS12]